MKRFAEELVCIILRLSKIPWIFREVLTKHRVTIVNYHDPGATRFSTHLRFLCRHYSIISLEQLVDCIQRGRWDSLPSKPLVLTFDDGHVGNNQLFPILDSFGVPYTVYVIAGCVGTRRKFWFKAPSITRCQIDMLKSMDDSSRRLWLFDNLGYADDQEYTTGDAFSLMELTNLRRPGICVGSHTVTHPLLDKCKREVAIYEINTSKSILENACGTTIRHFCYPNGNWNEEIVEMVKEAGYVTARTTIHGWVTSDTPLHILPNIGISDDASINKMVVQVCGLWGMLRLHKLPQGWTARVYASNKGGTLEK